MTLAAAGRQAATGDEAPTCCPELLHRLPHRQRQVLCPYAQLVVLIDAAGRSWVCGVCGELPAALVSLLHAAVPADDAPNSSIAPAAGGGHEDQGRQQQQQHTRSLCFCCRRKESALAPKSNQIQAMS